MSFTSFVVEQVHIFELLNISEFLEIVHTIEDLYTQMWTCTENAHALTNVSKYTEQGWQIYAAKQENIWSKLRENRYTRKPGCPFGPVGWVTR